MVLDNAEAVSFLSACGPQQQPWFTDGTLCNAFTGYFQESKLVLIEMCFRYGLNSVRLCVSSLSNTKENTLLCSKQNAVAVYI